MAKNMVKNDFKFSIVIPTYKENENLIKLIPLIYKILDTNSFNFELIISCGV